MYGGKKLDPGKCRPQGGMQPGCYPVEKLVFRQFQKRGFYHDLYRIEQLVGHTPLYCPERLLKGKQLYGKVLCKLEMFNPAGSVKDRAGFT